MTFDFRLFLPIDGVETSFIDIAIGRLGVLSSEEVDIVIPHDGVLFLPRLVGSRQLVLRRISFVPSESFIFGRQDIASEILRLVVYAAEEEQLVIVVHHRDTGETGERGAVHRELLKTIAVMLLDMRGVLEVPTRVQRFAVLCKTSDDHGAFA